MGLFGSVFKKVLGYNLYEKAPGKQWSSDPCFASTTIIDEYSVDIYTPGYQYRLVEVLNVKGVPADGRTIWFHYEPGTAVVDETTSKKEGPLLAVNKKRMEKLKSDIEDIAVVKELFASMSNLFGSAGGVGGSDNYGDLNFSGDAPWVFHPAIRGGIVQDIKEIVSEAMDKFMPNVTGNHGSGDNTTKSSNGDSASKMINKVYDDEEE